MAAKGYSSSLDSEYNSLTLTLIPPRVPGASEQDCSQQSLCAFSYAAFVSPRNNLMLEKKKKISKQETKINFPAAFASTSEYKASAGGCGAAS